MCRHLVQPATMARPIVSHGCRQCRSLTAGSIKLLISCMEDVTAHLICRPKDQKVVYSGCEGHPATAQIAKHILFLPCRQRRRLRT